MAIDYEKLTEITARSQDELDAIPLDFKGRIYIEFGSTLAPAIVDNKFYLPVEALGNSSVVAWGNSSVEAWGNVQVLDRLRSGKIKISGNARIIYNPKNIYEFMDYYGIKHTKTKATLYKAVRKDSAGIYRSAHNRHFTYTVGQFKREPSINVDVNESCGSGIHISHLNWALNFGNGWEGLAILEVETKITDIVCPVDTDGKVRTSSVKVIREVPLEECGLYGKMLAKRRQGRKERGEQL